MICDNSLDLVLQNDHEKRVALNQWRRTISTGPDPFVPLTFPSEMQLTAIMSLLLSIYVTGESEYSHEMVERSLASDKAKYSIGIYQRLSQMVQDFLVHVFLSEYNNLCMCLQLFHDLVLLIRSSEQDFVPKKKSFSSALFMEFWRAR